MRLAVVLVLALATAAAAYNVRIADAPAASPLRGRVEVLVNGQWGTVCDDYFGDEDARVLCRMMGYSAGIAVPNTEVTDGTLPIVLDDLHCDGTEADVLDCPHITTHNCIHAEDAGIDCSVADVRLVDEGGSPYRGRLEVKNPNDGQWGTVCDDYFDMNNNAANVVCRMMGYGSGHHLSNTQVPDGTLPILLDNVQCTGAEPHLFDCPANTWGSHNCGHYEDTGVECFVDNCQSTVPFRACDGSCYVDSDGDGLCDQEDDSNGNMCYPGSEPVDTVFYVSIPGSTAHHYVSTVCYPQHPHNHNCGSPDSTLGGRDVWFMNYDYPPIDGSVPDVCYGAP